ncbi:hypothetical protein HYV87_02305 [Candidatus Woesearchaeota archaeon]|nr:hypothetical protein [Candidatus Woesearchaeota archaeon]MBI2581940.1 hypothetical protein [Candidatus Woesearchaeota archaeon]
MKISTIPGESGRKNYISAGSKKIVSVTDLDGRGELAHHDIEWQTEINLERAIEMIKKASREAQAYQPLEKKPAWAVYAGKTLIVNDLNFFIVEDFLKSENPSSIIADDDVCIGLLTPYYALNFYNKPLSTKIRTGISQIKISVYANVSGLAANLIAKTSPVFAGRGDFAKETLAYHLNRFLAGYQPLVKLN